MTSMKIVKRFFFIALVISLVSACQVNHDAALSVDEPSIIPQPVIVKLNTGTYQIKNHTPVYCNSEDLLIVGKYLGEQLGGLEVKNGAGNGINLLIADEEIFGRQRFDPVAQFEWHLADRP